MRAFSSVTHAPRFSGFGKQTLSKQRTEPAVSIGSGPRFREARAKGTPGPADFKVAEAFGKQTVSVRKTAQSFSFGSR